MIVEATKNPAFAREILDRSEGKVADILVTGNLGELTRALERGRERLVAARQSQPAIEGEVITPQPVGVSDAVIAPATPLPEPL